MNHTEKLTRYIANFVDELAKSGLSEVVISPGSRSTPLAMTFSEHPSFHHWVIIDERSAAFFALGMAKKNKRPVAIVCTSGTAAANYFPAIVEAHYGRVPLVVLTADRPHELRDVGAPQAIDQIKLYSDYAKWFHEMALPEASPEMLLYARSKAARAVHLSGEGNAGPVHLNFPFREPLLPDFSLDNLWGKRYAGNYYAAEDGVRRLQERQLQDLMAKLKQHQKGLIVCGPQMAEEAAGAIAELAAAWKLPILADPLSQIRAGRYSKTNLIVGYDAFLRNETIRKKLKPEFVIRFGAMPVSKAYLFYVKNHKDAEQFVVEENAGYREPAGNKTEFIYAEPKMLCHDLLEIIDKTNFSRMWLHTWQQMDEIARKHLLTIGNGMLTEGDAVRYLMESIPDGHVLYVGNSMAIRDLDTFFMPTDKRISVLANRGANGIDGMVSSGLGAAAMGEHVTLLLGDLSFFHDLNGLLAAKHYALHITIVLINNNGGGIFSFLPQANDTKHFEQLFGTPADIDFRQAIEMYGGKYGFVKDAFELCRALGESYENKGLSVIEVKTDRNANTLWHRGKWERIEEEILAGEW